MGIFSIQSKAIFLLLLSFWDPKYCWLENSPVEFRVHFLFCSPTSKSLDMIQLISLTGIFTFLPFIKKNKTKQKQLKKPPQKQNNTAKTTKPKPKKNPQTPNQNQLTCRYLFLR